MNTKTFDALADVSDLIRGLQYMQAFKNHILTWQEYQEKMHTLLPETLRECHEIMERRRENM